MFSRKGDKGVPSPVRNTPSPSSNSAAMAGFFDLGSPRKAIEDPRLVFDQLGEDFGIHRDAIRHMVVVLQMQTLDDFRFYFATDEDVAKMVGRVRASGDMDDADYLDKGIAISRVRQAWDGLKRECAKRERSTEAVDSADLDEPLPAQDLQNLKKAHWNRYKAHYPAWIMCADVLISRIARELSKRALQVQAMSGVRTLTHQVTTTKKKRKVGTDLFTHDIPELNLTLDYEGYLDQMFTYFIAMSIAGCIRRPNPSPGGEAMHSNSALFIEIPFDVLSKYWWRATHSSKKQPFGQRLQWLQEKDIAEWSVWAEEFNKSEAPLGEVILHCYTQRDAHWYPPLIKAPEVDGIKQQLQRQASKQLAIEDKFSKIKNRVKGGGGMPPGTTQSSGGNGRDSVSRSNGGGGTSFIRGGNPTGPPTTAKLFGFPVSFRMKDGQQLCRAYQKGECKNNVDSSGKGCRDGLHKCAVLVNKEFTRVCRGNHPAKQHQRK